MGQFIQRIQSRNQDLQKLMQVPVPVKSPDALSPLLQQALDYIERNLDQAITLEDIASDLGISQFHFCRYFKKHMGIAPYRYVIQQRVERAKQLIKGHKLSLVEIALLCGFNSQSHLIHHFKKQTGITPKTYRSMAQRGLAEV